jgi:hypothetical protein
MYPFQLRVLLYNRTPNGRDVRFRRVLKFLISKGYVNSRFPPRGTYLKEISLKDFLWAAEAVEPVFFELLPVLVIRFSGQIKDCDELPEDLNQAIEYLVNQSEENDHRMKFKNIPMRVVRMWLKFETKDKRIRPVQTKLKTFRIDIKELSKLEKIAAEKKISLTAALHEQIKKT